MDDRRNYYRVLHLQPDAPIELVRVNYRTLIQKLRAHPDLGGENWSAAHLNAAYHTLSDAKRRAAYDRELLSHYDIEVIAQGRAKPRARSGARAGRGSVNRRSYYRVLETQRDAPFGILEASHRALRAAHPERGELLDQALALLCNPMKRQVYDRLLDACGHNDALSQMHVEFGRAPDYEPVIQSYCAFCKTPHVREEGVPDARCRECDSPLYPPPRNLLGLARRTCARVTRDEPVTLYTDWPMAGVAGQVIDLSPTGMRCETAARLDLNDVVKVASPRFDAIGSVAHIERDGAWTHSGLRFLTVRFPLATGNFQSVKV